MDFAEQEPELYRIVTGADEEKTAKLIRFCQSLDHDSSQFTAEKFAEFERRRQDYLKNPGSGIPWEEALGRIREKLAK